jgi:hypothetical protein
MLFVRLSACLADGLIGGRCALPGKWVFFLLCAPLMRVDSLLCVCVGLKQHTHRAKFWLDSRNLTRTVSHHLRRSLFLSIKLLATFFIYLFAVCPWGRRRYGVCVCKEGARPPAPDPLSKQCVASLVVTCFLFCNLALLSYSPGARALWTLLLPSEPNLIIICTRVFPSAQNLTFLQVAKKRAQDKGRQGDYDFSKRVKLLSASELFTNTF